MCTHANKTRRCNRELKNVYAGLCLIGNTDQGAEADCDSRCRRSHEIESAEMKTSRSGITGSARLPVSCALEPLGQSLQFWHSPRSCVGQPWVARPPLQIARFFGGRQGMQWARTKSPQTVRPDCHTTFGQGGFAKSRFCEVAKSLRGRRISTCAGQLQCESRRCSAA